MAEMLCLEMIKTIFVPYFPGIDIISLSNVPNLEFRSFETIFGKTYSVIYFNF